MEEESNALEVTSKFEISSPRGRRLAGDKGEGKAPRTHQVMGSNPWEVVTPKMGNPGGDFGLVGSPKGAGHRRL